MSQAAMYQPHERPARRGPQKGAARTWPAESVSPNGMPDPQLLARLVGDCEELEDWATTVLQDSAQRAVIRFTLRYAGTSAERILIAKRYERGDGVATFAFMRELWRQGFARSALAIPEPLAFISEEKLLVQSEAPGQPLYDLLDDPQRGVGHARQAGTWVAKLHAVALEGLPVFGPLEEERKLGRYRDELADAYPGWAARIDSLTRAVTAAIAELGGDVQVPTHGDYQPKNIYVGPHGVTVIDFDRFSLAHPARDLGHFLGQCLTMWAARKGSFSGIGCWTDAFVEGYTEEGEPGALQGLGAYIARTICEVLYYKLVVRPVRDPAFVPAWLDECERWLESTSAGIPAGTGREAL